MAAASTQDAPRTDIKAALDLDRLPEQAYRDGEYLRRVIDAGFEVETIAQAHDVRPRTIYKALDAHGIESTRPPTSSPLARQLWQLDPSAVGGDRSC